MAGSDAPIFLAEGKHTGEWTFANPTSVVRWVRQLAYPSGCVLAVTIVNADDVKTRLQEAGFHVMLKPWCEHRGDELTALKQWLLAEIFGTYRIKVPGGRYATVLHEPHTSQLSKTQYSLLIERTLQIAAEDGFVLTAPDEYRLLQEAEADKARRKAKKGRARGERA